MDRYWDVDGKYSHGVLKEYKHWILELNCLSRLHFHGIPRYKEEREYAGKIRKDESWGSIPKWSFTEVDSSLLKRMGDELLKEFK